MAPTRDDVRSWTDEAFRTLERAKELSSLAQVVLESTSHSLTDVLAKRLQTATEKMETAKDQHLNTAALVEYLRAKVNDLVASHNRSVEKLLDPALKSLDDVLTSLRATPMPSFLIDDDDTKLYHLGDFVSVDDIALLTSNISIYRANCAKAHALLAQNLAALLEEYHRNSAKYTRATKLYEAHVVGVQMALRLGGSESNLVRTILKENASLEQELVSLLEMLTNHYDQCLVALSLKDGVGVDFDVLHSDTLELPLVLKEFGAIHDIIINNEARAAKFVDLKLPHIENAIGQCDGLLECYATFKSHDLTRFVLLLLECEKVFRACSIENENSRPTIDVYVDVLNHLRYHYTQFHAIYESQYLTELHYEQFVYPRKFLKLLHEYLNGPLLQLEEEERERRRNWLRKYGAFIPKEFALPGEYNQPTVVQVISEGLEEIQSPGAHDEEGRLLQLIKSLRPQN